MRYLTTLAALLAAILAYGYASGTLHPEPIDAAILATIVTLCFAGDALIEWMDQWEKRQTNEILED